MFSTVLRASIDSLSPENHAPTASELSMLTTLRTQPKIRMPLFPGSGRHAEDVQLTRFFHWLDSATCGWETRKPETAAAMSQTFHLLLSPSSSALLRLLGPLLTSGTPKRGKVSFFFFSRFFDSRLATGRHLATYPLLFPGMASRATGRSTAAGSTGSLFDRAVLGASNRSNPSDRAKLGSKRHLICDGQGGLQQGKQQQE
jgi:hypothetical protein